MGLLNFSLPIIGSSAATEDPKVRTALDDIKTWGNGNIESVNLASAVKQQISPAFVTSLPGSPVDGQEIYYQASASNGVVWHLRYNASSSSTFKWEFLGGSPIGSYIGGSSVNNTSSNVSTGHLVDVPLAGVYEVEWGGYVSHDGSGARSVWLYLYLNGSVVNIGGVDSVAVHRGIISDNGTVSQKIRNVTVGTAGHDFDLYLGGAVHDTGVNWYTDRRFLYARPIRVGP